MPITTLLDVKCPSIRLTGVIDMDVCLGLIDEMKILHGYYQYRTIELEIDSPGGDGEALNHLVQFLAPWSRGEGRILKTKGLNHASSAAALLLSFGTLGHRTACRHSRLLYHHARRNFPNGSSQTVSQLRGEGKQLETWENLLLEQLIAHVGRLPGRKNNSNAYRKSLQRLMAKDRPIDAKEACEMGLIDKIV
jgi:ATP-dependent protease ClpP protease subunit